MIFPTGALCAELLANGNARSLPFVQHGSWTELQLPAAAPKLLASVIELKLNGTPGIEQTLGVQPNFSTTLLAEFAGVSGASKARLQWMEKFGEWKFAVPVSDWSQEGRAIWTIDVARAGDYKVELTYRGVGHLVWAVETDEGCKIQNQQNSSEIYAPYPFGMLNFATPSFHTITVSLVEVDAIKTGLKSVRFIPAK